MEYELGYNGNASGMGYSWNLNDHVGNPIPRSYEPPKKHGGWRSIQCIFSTMGCWICWVFWTLVTLVGWDEYDESLSHVMTYLRAGKSGVEWDEMVQTTWKYDVAKKTSEHPMD